MTTVLDATGLVATYGPVRALNGVDLRIEEGEVVTLIGPNGAGKSTLLRSLIGVHRRIGGTVRFGGVDITNAVSHDRVRLGMALVPEGRGVLHAMSVEENLLMGAYARRDRRAARADLDAAWTRFPILAERRSQLAGTLSGGQQQMLAIGRALMARPKLLMMDEPSLGLAPLVVESVFKTITDLRDEGMTVLLVEQNAHMALEVASRGYVLETGTVAVQGTAGELAVNPIVQEVYLGGG